MLGIKQDALAYELGDDWNQQKVSLLEQKETISDPLLEQIARILKVPTDAIKNFNAEHATNIISNNTFDNCSQPAASIFYNATINPMDKWIEALDEIKRLNDALLKEKDEKIALLEKVLSAKNK